MPTKEEAEAWKKQLLDDAEKNIMALTDSDKFKEYLAVMGKFHSYSARNISLIFSQNPNASRVAGFKQWQNDFNRQVNKGAKSIRIAAPIIKKLTAEQKKRLNTTQDKGIVGYRFIPVFDVSQTNGQELASAKDFVADNLKETVNVERLYKELKQHINDNTDISVVEKELEDSSVKGYYRPSANEIAINSSEQNTTLKLKTLYHEYAHSQLHAIGAEYQQLPRPHKEAQAESVAYIAMKNLGIDTDTYSLGYVATWAQNKETIHKALSEIQNISGRVIEMTDVLTNKLGLQEELKSPEKMTTQQLNSQFSNIKKEIVRIDNEIAGKSEKETSLKRTERAKLSDNLGNLSKEMHKRTQNELKSYASDNPEVKSEKKQEQKQIMTHN